MSGGRGALPRAAFWPETKAEEAAEGHEIEEEEAGRDGEEAQAKRREGEAGGGKEVEQKLEAEAGAVRRDARQAGARCEGAEEEKDEDEPLRYGRLPTVDEGSDEDKGGTAIGKE